MPRPKENHFKQLAGDMKKVAFKTAFSTFLFSNMMFTNSVPTDNIVTGAALSFGGGGVNLLLGKLDQHYLPEPMKENDLPKIMESIFVGINPITIISTLNSELTPGMKAVILFSLAFLNCLLMFGSRRLAEMEDQGGGKDLRG